MYYNNTFIVFFLLNNIVKNLYFSSVNYYEKINKVC